MDETEKVRQSGGSCLIFYSNTKLSSKIVHTFWYSIFEVVRQFGVENITGGNPVW